MEQLFKQALVLPSPATSTGRKHQLLATALGQGKGQGVLIRDTTGVTVVRQVRSVQNSWRLNQGYFYWLNLEMSQLGAKMWLYKQPGVLAVPDCSADVTGKFLYARHMYAWAYSLVDMCWFTLFDRKAKGMSNLVTCG